MYYETTELDSSGFYNIENKTANIVESPSEEDPIDVEITTFTVETVDEYQVINFDKKTTLESIIIPEYFPVLDYSSYSITVFAQDSTEKSDWTEYIGSKNTIVVYKDGEEVAKFTAIVPGDITGNGILRMYDAFQILKDAIVGTSLDSLDCIIRDHSSSGDRIVRMYDAFQYLKEAIVS